MRAAVLAALAFLLPMPAAAAAPPASIVYETTACFGFCPVYRVTIDARGRGLFEGLEHTRVKGKRAFRVPPARYRALAARIAGLRPPRGERNFEASNRCRGAGAPRTDAASIHLAWREAGGRSQSLSFYSGCPQEDVRESLAAARKLLPVDAFIGTR